MITRNAHAKLNVFLRVLGRRDDGYHDIETVMLPVDLHVVVTVAHADRLGVLVDGPRADELSDAGGESLVHRTAQAWSEATGRADAGARITIE